MWASACWDWGRCSYRWACWNLWKPFWWSLWWRYWKQRRIISSSPSIIFIAGGFKTVCLKLNFCPIRGLCLNNPTTFFSGVYLLRRIADLPLLRKKGAWTRKGDTHLSNPVGRLLLTQYGRVDFLFCKKFLKNYFFSWFSQNISV